jgi:hypothetical protein
MTEQLAGVPHSWLVSALSRAALDAEASSRAAEYAAYLGADLLRAPVQDVSVLLIGRPAAA